MLASSIAARMRCGSPAVSLFNTSSANRRAIEYEFWFTKMMAAAIRSLTPHSALDPSDVGSIEGVLGQQALLCEFVLRESERLTKLGEELTQLGVRAFAVSADALSPLAPRASLSRVVHFPAPSPRIQFLRAGGFCRVRSIVNRPWRRVSRRGGSPHIDTRKAPG